jgi:site-specific recombinase XerD
MKRPTKQKSSSQENGKPSAANPKPSPLAGRRFPAEPLTPDEVKALLKACSNRAPTGVRNRAMLSILYRCGLRVGEVVALMVKDFDPAAGTVRILHGKGDKCRVVGIDPEAVAIVQRWLDKRATIGLNGRHALFSTLQGRPLQTVYLRNLMKRLAKKTGLAKRANPHSLRHSFAFELANEGTPVHCIQQILGHTSLATTDRYIRHLNPRAAIEAMQQRTWKM